MAMHNPLLLIMRLEGPLQSWGIRAQWDVRDTSYEPTKSGIIGLLGCALGYHVFDERLRVLDENLVIGVREEHPGTVLRDYQTITAVFPTADGKNKGSVNDPYTIVSPRYYLQDAAFLCIVSGPEDMLQRCKAALQAPKWPLYLGRKCCLPTRPVFEALTRHYPSLEHALRNYEWSWEGAASESQAPARLRCVLENLHGNLTRLDRLCDSGIRMYQTRKVIEFSIDRPRQQEAMKCSSPA